MTDITVEKTQEELLVGAVLRQGSLFKQAREIIAPANFRMEPLKAVWEAFTELDDERLTIDVFTTYDMLQRKGCEKLLVSGQWSGMSYLTELRGKGEPRNWQTYAENVSDYSLKRKLAPRLQQYTYQAENGSRGRDVLSNLMEELASMDSYRVTDEYTVPVGDALAEAYDWSVLAAQGKIPGVLTGFVDLDAMLKALIAGNVYIVAGRPGMGKTAFMLTVALAAAKAGKKVAIFSLEMSKMQVAQRLIAMHAEIDLERIIDGSMENNEWVKFTNAIEYIEALGIVINDRSSISINSGIRTTARKLKAAGKADIVLVDYVQLVAPEKLGVKQGTRELEVSAVSRGLKYLADELKVPVLAGAQLSRAVEQRADRRPVLSDLRESGSLEQDAYCVMFIHRNPEEPEPRQNVTEIIVAKHRNGKTGSVELIWRPIYATFSNASRKEFTQ